MHETKIASPWTPYGLSDDPFFQEPLAPTDTASRPISLFVGREGEVQLLGNQIVGSSSSRAIIQGLPGVGKTSFVNRVKAVVATRGVLTHERPVKITTGMSPRQFCAEVLRVLLQIRSTLAPPTLPARGAAKAAHVASGARRKEDAFWRRAGRMIEGEDTIAGGVTIAAVGAQRERGRIAPEVDNMSLDAEVARAVRQLADGGKRPVLIHVNNIENLSPDDADAAALLVQNLRDVFLTEHAHWLFVGADDIEQRIFRRTGQVGGIVPFAVELSPLLPDDVAELLHRRYRHLQMGVHLIPPIEPAVAAALYPRYRGDLRNFLRLLSRVVQHHAIMSPGRPLSANQIVDTMAPRYWPDLVKRVGGADAEHLAAMLHGQPYDAEFRVADAARAAGIKQSSASKLVQRLLDAGVIIFSRQDGRSVYYRVSTGDATVALALR